MRAMVAEGEQSLSASPHYHAFLAPGDQKQLTVAQLALVAHRLAPVFDNTCLEFARAGIAAINADLVAINQRSAQPARYAQYRHANRHQHQARAVRLLRRRSQPASNVDEEKQVERIESAMDQAALLRARI